MALRIADGCIGCGACESACWSGAITQTDGYLVGYRVEARLCNDCLDCVVLCPVEAFEPDPTRPVYLGRGCPLGSARYASWECSQAHQHCPTCGSVLWRPPNGEWVCRSCRLGDAGRGARCPKGGVDRRIPSRSPQGVSARLAG